MIKSSQDVYLVFKALFPICRLESRFFLKCFHCKEFTVLNSLGQVNTCKVTFTYLFHSFKEFMKSSSFHCIHKYFLPVIKTDQREKLIGFWAYDSERPPIGISDYVVAKVKVESIGALQFFIGKIEGVREKHYPGGKIIHKECALDDDLGKRSFLQWFLDIHILLKQLNNQYYKIDIALLFYTQISIIKLIFNKFINSYILASVFVRLLIIL